MHYLLQKVGFVCSSYYHVVYVPFGVPGHSTLRLGADIHKLKVE